MTIRRRDPSAARNSLNEPDYGDETTWPIIYSDRWVRTEYPDLQMQFTETGERIMLPSSAASGVNMYVESDTTVLAEDRVIITSIDDATLINQLYIVTAVFPEYNAMGDTHHYIVELQIH